MNFLHNLYSHSQHHSLILELVNEPSTQIMLNKTRLEQSEQKNCWVKTWIQSDCLVIGLFGSITSVCREIVL